MILFEFHKPTEFCTSLHVSLLWFHFAFCLDLKALEVKEHRFQPDWQRGNGTDAELLIPSATTYMPGVIRAPEMGGPEGWHLLQMVKWERQHITLVFVVFLIDHESLVTISL